MPDPGIRDVAARLSDIHPTAAIDDSAHIGPPAEARDRASSHPAVIDAYVTIRECVRVHAGTERETVIGRQTLLMAGSHVGHDARLGVGCEVSPNAVICGHAEIGNGVKIGSNATILPYRRVGDGARIGAGAVVTKDVPEGEVWVGNPAAQMVKSHAATR